LVAHGCSFDEYRLAWFSTGLPFSGYDDNWVLQLEHLGVFGYLGLMLVYTCLIGVAAEVLYRGLIFRILEEWLGSWLALAISAFLFDMAYIGGDGYSDLLSVMPPIAFDLWAAAAYTLARKLWLSIGLHWRWDFILYTLGGGSWLFRTNQMSPRPCVRAYPNSLVLSCL
jgi:membrane protease YdiL (CAAX protease family)